MTSEQFDTQLAALLTAADPPMRAGWRDRALAAMRAATPAPAPSLPGRWFSVFTSAARWQQATAVVAVLFLAIFVRQLVAPLGGEVSGGLAGPAAFESLKSADEYGAPGFAGEMAKSKAEGRVQPDTVTTRPMRPLASPSAGHPGMGGPGAMMMGAGSAAGTAPAESGIVTSPEPVAEQAPRVVSFDTYGHKLIMTSTIGLETKDVRAAYNRVQALAAARGVIIASASLEPGPPTKDGRPVYGHAIVVLRPPQMDFDRVRQAIMDMAATTGCRVRSDQVSSQDVTGRFTDLDSRLRHWRSQEAQLLAIMRQARRIPDILSVRDQLSNVQESIEQITGELNALKDRINLASVTVEIFLKGRAQPVLATKPTLSSNLKNAGKQIAAAWTRSLQDVVRIVAFIIMAVTYLLPFGVIAAIVWLPIRAARKRSAAKTA